jgi:hypothetical protein
MAQLKPTKTVYTISQFLENQRQGSLILRPFFQRGEIWNEKAKSLLIDTVVKGLPIPIILLRRVQNLDTLKSELEVIDGQQRLRTILAFVDPGCLTDFRKDRDTFSVLEAHNEDIANTPFSALPKGVKLDILNYELSTHVFPASTGDADVLLMFSRLNSTGARLNPQELRNAQFYGEFKTVSYKLALQNLIFWQRHCIFSNQEIARMSEVEMTSDLLLVMNEGIGAGTKKRIDDAYQRYDSGLPGSKIMASRFQNVIDEIEHLFGTLLGKSSLRRQPLFYSLFSACYDHMFGLGSRVTTVKRKTLLPRKSEEKFTQLDEAIKTKSLPGNVQDAADRATANPGRRQTRHNHFMEALGLVSAG